MKTTGKNILAAVLALGCASGAVAEPRYNPTKMSCSAVQGVIDQQGAVTLRYQSTRVRNLPLYNRYVSNSHYCPSGEYAASANVPTLDDPTCRVQVCQQRDNDNQVLFPRFRD
nr:hypothetical protein [uncultured Gellertiella sp.]